MPDLLCRVCLSGNIKMRTIQSTELQDVYELLAKNQLITNGCPETVCFICHAQLQRCSKFSKMALQSDKIFKYLVENGIETTQVTIKGFNMTNLYNLTITAPEIISIDNPLLESTIDTPFMVPQEAPFMVPQDAPFMVPQDAPFMVSINVPVMAPQDAPDMVSIDVPVMVPKDESVLEPQDAPVMVPQDAPVIVKSEVVDVPSVSGCPPVDTVVKEEADEKLIKVEIQDPLDSDLQNSVPTEGVLKVPTTMLLTQLQKYMGQSKKPDLDIAMSPIIDTDTNDIEMAIATNIIRQTLPVKPDIAIGNQGDDPVTAMAITGTGQDNGKIPRKSKIILDKKHNIPITKMKDYNECDVCHKVFHKRLDMDVHMRLHNGVKPYACNNCDQRFSLIPQLNHHVRYQHNRYKNSTCKICHYTFSTKGYLERHMETHAKTKYNCAICSMPFTNFTKYRGHVSSHSYKYQCDDCKKTFKSKNGVHKHIVNVHMLTKPFVCNVCNLSFDSANMLSEHHVVHTGHDYCKLCKLLVEKRKIKRHVCEIKEKLFSCSVCRFKTAYEVNLRTHMIKIHDEY